VNLPVLVVVVSLLRPALDSTTTPDTGWMPGIGPPHTANVPSIIPSLCVDEHDEVTMVVAATKAIIRPAVQTRTCLTIRRSSSDLVLGIVRMPTQ